MATGNGNNETTETTETTDPVNPAHYRGDRVMRIIEQYEGCGLIDEKSRLDRP